MAKNKGPRKRSSKPKPKPAKKKKVWWKWAAITVPIVALAAVAVLGGRDNAVSGSTVGAKAADFNLATSDGGRQTLDGVLANGDALLFFSMGLGCDGCFAQIPEIEAVLASSGITLVPIMVDPAALVAAEARRFGVAGPILIDADRSVSKAYGMIGIYGHSDRPSHSFALVNQQAEITWIRHYSEMFVRVGRLMSDLGDG